jgi:pimeloyl-ACP methyl ester carboxylesterase
LSGLFVPASSAVTRGLLVALPGGGLRAAYYHLDVLPDASLLSVASSLGFDALALDRPGYGRSTDSETGGFDIAEQVEILAGALRDVAVQRDADQVFLAGHSLGGLVALEAAARPDAPDWLLGVALAGVPARRSPERQAELARVADLTDRSVVIDPERAASAYFGPPWTYDSRVLAALPAISAPVPAKEYRDAVVAHERFDDLAASVDVPVLFTAAEFEHTSEMDADILVEVGQAFSRAPAVETHVQRASGHNISMSRVARSYHLRVVAFAQQFVDCAVR